MGYPFLTITFDRCIATLERYNEWKQRFESTKNTLKYVATGSEGGATGFFSKTLKNAGLNCAHEHLFFFRNPWSPPYYGACSWFLAPFFSDPLLKRFTRVHLLRFPIRVINTQFTIINGASKPVANHLKFFMARYRRWHYGIQSSNPDIIFQAERGEQELLKVLGLNRPASGIGKIYNSKRNKPFTDINFSVYKELGLDKEIKILCNEFGYDVNGSMLKLPDLNTASKKFFIKEENPMLPIITSESAKDFDLLEKYIIELNRFDTVREWHWSPAYDYVSKVSGPYITVWCAQRDERSVATRYMTAKLEACVPALLAELNKVKKPDNKEQA